MKSEVERRRHCVFSQDDDAHLIVFPDLNGSDLVTCLRKKKACHWNVECLSQPLDYVSEGCNSRLLNGSFCALALSHDEAAIGFAQRYIN
jgi:hypothetical protein